MERYHYGTISCMILVLYFLYCKLAHIMFIFRERRNQDYTLWKPHQNTVWEPANLTYIWPPESKTSLRPNWWNWNVLTSRCILAIVSLSRDVSERRTATGSELFYYLTCLHTITFILLSIFSVVETIRLKIRRRPLSCDVHFRFLSLLENATCLSPLLTLSHALICGDLIPNSP